MTGSEDPYGCEHWAEREQPYSSCFIEQPSTEFFIPGRGPAEAEALWAELVQGHRPDSRRVYSLTYRHDELKIEAKVGEHRREYRRRAGPRGAYIPDIGFERYPWRTGSRVLAIVDACDVIEVWPGAPPGGPAGPSLVSPGAVERIQYFKAPERESGAT